SSPANTISRSSLGSASHRLVGKGFAPHAGKLAVERKFSDPRAEVGEVDCRAILAQQHRSVGLVDDSAGEQLVQDHVLTGEHGNLDVKARQLRRNAPLDGCLLIRTAYQEQIDLHLAE